MAEFSYISEPGGSGSNAIAKAVALNLFPNSNSTFPKCSKRFGSDGAKFGLNANVRLATVKPQRIASVAGSSLRPFRVPEASRILFRSVRGKYGIKGWPSLPEVVAGANTTSSLASSSDQPPSVALISEKQSFSPIIPSNWRKGSCDLVSERDGGDGCSSTNITNHQQPKSLPPQLSSVVVEPDPAEESKLEAITIANTIANKNANKITGPKLNHSEHTGNGVVLTKPAIGTKPTSINSIMTSIKPTSSDPRRIVPQAASAPKLPPPNITATIVGSSRKKTLGKEVESRKGTNLAKFPPPLIGNTIIPPPPSLDEDEDDNEENEGGSSNDDNNNATTNDQACLTKAKSKSSVKPVPMAAPRIQTLTKSKGHVYQNIPFTKKTARHEV